MKLSAKFARQESAEARLARVMRKRVSKERAAAIYRMLSLPESLAATPARRMTKASDTEAPSSHAVNVCPDCSRGFALPMHLGRHIKAKHGIAAP
jgi:hypothetical protein